MASPNWVERSAKRIVKKYITLDVEEHLGTYQKVFDTTAKDVESIIKGEYNRRHKKRGKK